MIEIFVFKSRRVLEVHQEGRCLHTFTIGIGRGEPGTKNVEGDCKTPEGEYRIGVKNPRSKFHLSLGLNYPNAQDAERGRQAGLISDEEYRAIVDAHAQGRLPPWKTKLGGEIYLHGHLETHASTRGCVNLRNPDMTTLFQLASVGTKVTIKP